MERYGGKSQRPNTSMFKKTYGNMEVAKKEGFLDNDTINDACKNHSDPPYMVIKPQYRAHIPLPNFNQLDMKNRYSFKPFGDQNMKRPTQKVDESPYRNTLHTDTMYFRVSENAVNMQHALVDPTHTFHQEPRKIHKRNNSYMVYDLKPKGI